MNVTFIEKIRQKPNVEIDKHSGSYELVREAIIRFAKVSLNQIDENDLEMLYQFGNLKHGQKMRERDILNSNLLDDDKQYILYLNAKIASGIYDNPTNPNNRNCGIFAKGKTTLKLIVDKKSAQVFIEMLTEVLAVQDNDRATIFHIVEKCLTKKIKGIGVGIASQILHLFKPDIFPILNKVGQNG